MPSVVTSGEYMIYWIGLAIGFVIAVIAAAVSRMK